MKSQTAHARNLPFMLSNTVDPLKKCAGSLRLASNYYPRFSFLTVNYGPLFFPSIYGPRALRLGHKSMRKNAGRNLQYGPRTRLIRGYLSTDIARYIL